MKKSLISFIVILLTGIVFSQESDEENGRPPRSDSQVITEEQKTQAAAVLSKYDFANLTADDAKAIHRAMRDIGIHGGPGEDAVIQNTGHDPEILKQLDPPPGHRGEMKSEEGEDEEMQNDHDTPAPRGDQEIEEREQPSNETPARVQKTEKRSPREKGRKGKNGGGQKYSIEQAVSENAQLHTIAFSGLAFLTGDFGADTFLPPGKVCDFFGFQYMRDIDAAQKGHNPKFLDRVAGNVLSILTSEQRSIFEQAARQESKDFQILAEKRLPLIKAFYRELKGEIPSGSKGLNKEAVKKYVGDIFAYDAELSYHRAKIFGQIASSFTPEQKATLAKMKFGDFNSWPEVDMDQYKLPRGTEKIINVAYMTYASEFFSWYAGSVEADTYFCPERHGTYFGGFYMKDMPAMGKKDYDISTSVTGDSGKEFIETLTQAQRENITKLPDLQRNDLKEIVSVRKSISGELRKFLKGGEADKARVLALGRKYGVLDGEMSFYDATAFARVNKTLTQEQRKTLIKLRNLEGYTSAPAYLYSTPVKEEITLPDTDSFFFQPKGTYEN